MRKYIQIKEGEKVQDNHLKDSLLEIEDYQGVERPFRV